jgi:hypothetical protein
VVAVTKRTLGWTFFRRDSWGILKLPLTLTEGCKKKLLQGGDSLAMPW